MWEAGARSPQSILISWSNRSPYIQPPRLSISMVCFLGYRGVPAGVAAIRVWGRTQK